MAGGDDRIAWKIVAGIAQRVRSHYTCAMQTRFLLCLASTSFLGCMVTPSSVPVDPNATPVLAEGFSKTSEVPPSFLVLNGGVTLAATNRNRFLALPAKPLDTHGVMFGPAMRDGLRVAARFRGEQKGRQSPAFGVGLNGISGYRLRVNPARRKLELLRNEVRVHEADYQWVPGQWTHMMLQVRELPGLQWAIEAKVWDETQRMPAAWTLTWKDADAPLPGRPSAWGTPYSGTAIGLDDLQVWRID